MQLVIVESPTKARKLKGYLGKDYQVEASVGHVRDLPKQELGIDIDNNFKPKYVVSDDKKKVIKTLKDKAAKAELVVLAMDPDREGEAIAWHVKHLLKEKASGAKTKSEPKFVRSTFHEITKQAVLDAIANPTRLNMDLVDAQQARRVLDRLVGYQISPVLWRKIRRGLSAGRVQSVALRLIVEKEREIEAFKPEEYWQIEVALSAEKAGLSKDKAKYFKEGKVVENLAKGVLVASLDKVNNKKFGQPVTTQAQVEPIIKSLAKADYQIDKVEKKERKRNSLPPFTTSLLQQNAATRLGFSSKKTMTLAQQLYEEGLITYHRTDSFNLSESSVAMAREYISSHFGPEYLPAKANFFKSKSKNAQEAHEAIRVTDVQQAPEEILAKSKKFGSAHVKLYDLIWRRFVASQMTAALYDQTSILIKADPQGKKDIYWFKATGSVMKFAGWTKLFSNSQDTLLPEVEEGQKMDYLADNPLQKFTQPPARYNDASLVKELEKKGIGRPSTYASIISVILDRAYVERIEKKFHATPVGMTVSDFLVDHFEMIMDYDFTAEMEEDLDRISRGEKEWQQIVATFWKPIAKKIDGVIEKADRAVIPVEKTGEKCPECGATEGGEIVIRTGKYGKFKSCSRYPDCKFTQNIVDKVEGVVCPLCGKGDVIARKSRWGKPFFGCSRYPECDWASWKQPEPGEKLSKKEWEVMKIQRAERAAKRKAAWEEKNKAKATKTKSAAAKSSTGAKSSKATKAKKTSRKASKKK